MLSIVQLYVIYIEYYSLPFSMFTPLSGEKTSRKTANIFTLYTFRCTVTLYFCKHGTERIGSHCKNIYCRTFIPMISFKSDCRIFPPTLLNIDQFVFLSVLFMHLNCSFLQPPNPLKQISEKEDKSFTSFLNIFSRSLNP